jgi:hypothetical protein
MTENLVGCSDAGAVACEDRAISPLVLRWVILGAAAMAFVALGMIYSVSVGAAAPASYQAPYPVTTTSGSATTTASTTSASGYPPNTVVSTYADPRYCNGLVSVVTDSSGNLIDVCTTTGQRIYPVYPDYGYGFTSSLIGANYVAPIVVNTPTYVAPAYIAPGTANGITCNGVYGCPFFGGFIPNGNSPYVNGNFANNYGYLNTNVFPAGGTVVGGVVYYNDNRFCGDGKVAFVPNRGYFCQNGGPLVTNGVNTVNCGNFFLNGCGIWRGYEADAAASPAAATQPQQVTAYAAPEAKAPVAAPAAPVVAPAAPVVAPAAPVSAKIAVGVPGIAPVGGVQIDPSSR